MASSPMQVPHMHVRSSVRHVLSIYSAHYIKDIQYRYMRIVLVSQNKVFVPYSPLAYVCGSHRQKTKVES